MSNMENAETKYVESSNITPSEIRTGIIVFLRG